MKSRVSLSRFLILYPLLFTTNLFADEMAPDVLYKKAQLAYQKSDCADTLYYLKAYLKADKPSETKRAAIDEVMQWCSKFLAKGVVTSEAYGLMEINPEPELTEAGKRMLLDKPTLQLQ